MYGETVLGYLKTSLKGLPQWTKGIWLSKTISNDCHIIGTPIGIFITRSIRRLPESFQLELLGEITASPWEYGYANLGHRLIYTRRSSLPPGVATGTTLNLGDKDALAVRDYARAHPYEDVGAAAISAEAGDVTSATPAIGVEHVEGATVSTQVERASGSEMQQDAGSVPSDLQHSGKHTTDHSETGGDSKRLHTSDDVSSPHGDVVPQTPQSEHVRDVLDDTPVEDMMSPNKVAKHGDGPGSVNLLGQLRQIEHLDIEPGVSLQEQDFDTVLQHELSLEEDPYEPINELSDNMKELSYPYTPHEPELTAEELQRLDSIADRVEVERLSGLNVLLEDNLPSDAKCLSTRFVRTWREKKDQDGNAIWLRRSRLVAREYTWLQPDREALFSPASSNIATRILPICFLALREHQETLMLAIDVKDAFLTVEQEEPTRVKCIAADGTSISYSLGRVLPGQLDGSLLWHKDLVRFLGNSSLKMVENEAYPSMLRSSKGDCLMLVHIDDILIVGARTTVLEELIPSLQAKYTISIEIMSGPGDEVTFLKKDASTSR